MGLPCRRHCCRRGGLLPHLFTLTSLKSQIRDLKLQSGGIFSVALIRHDALKRRARAFTRNPALRCPDFPLRIHSARFNPHLQRTRSEGLAPKLAAGTYGIGPQKQGSSPPPHPGNGGPFHSRVASAYFSKNTMRPHWSQVVSSSSLRACTSMCVGTFKWQPPHLLPVIATQTGCPGLTAMRS